MFKISHPLLYVLFLEKSCQFHVHHLAAHRKDALKNAEVLGVFQLKALQLVHSYSAVVTLYGHLLRAGWSLRLLTLAVLMAVRWRGTPKRLRNRNLFMFFRAIAAMAVRHLRQVVDRKRRHASFRALFIWVIEWGFDRPFQLFLLLFAVGVNVLVLSIASYALLIHVDGVRKLTQFLWGKLVQSLHIIDYIEAPQPFSYGRVALNKGCGTFLVVVLQ